jgi:flagellar protein FliO/FliZ
MSVISPNYPIRFPSAPDIVMWRVVAACRRKSMTEPAIFLVYYGLGLLCGASGTAAPAGQGSLPAHIGTLVNGLLGAGKQVLAASLRALAQDPEMPSMTDTDSIILGVAAFLFALALIALIAWPFKTFVLTGRSGTSLLRGRDLRLGVVATASVDGHRKLILIRRDTVEHLFMTGGPVDVLIETEIEGQQPLGPPLEDVIIARAETRPAPDFSKT